MSENYERELSVAIEAVTEAARLCRAISESISPETMEKQDRSPVTIADYGAQAIVSRVLEAAFPNDPIIGEEDAGELRDPAQAPFLEALRAEYARYDWQPSADEIVRLIDRCGQQEYCSRFWTLDPIDGTKGFLRKEQYAVSLALIVDGEIVVAAVGCPNLGTSVDESVTESGGTLFTAIRGQGTLQRSLNEQTTTRPVKVSSQSDLTQMRFCESVESGHSSHDHSAQAKEILGIQAEPVRLDSQAKYGVVARGEAEIYLRLPTRPGYQEKIWDHAGGVLVVEEAGGRVSDVTGKPLDFRRGAKLTENRGVVVTNGTCHDRVIEVLKQVGVQ